MVTDCGKEEEGEVSFELEEGRERWKGRDESERKMGTNLGTLRDSVLGELSGKDESDGGLDLPGRDGGLLVVGSELGSLGSDSLEDIVDEGVEDGHGLVGDTSVGVDLEGRRKEGRGREE